jgi:23S rRNA (guanine2445-N2)-methyltransferase / 23S rRNA (guanine2069-N7)-methyltransferase
MAIQQQLTFFATAPKYLSELLAVELTELGAEIISTKLAGVQFRCVLAVAYRACLWSRLANRILYPLATFSAADPEALYQGIQQIDWSTHLNITNYLAVDFSTRDSKITHTQYGAQKVKDAIVDQFRAKYGDRPSVRKDNPDVMINIYLYRDIATVSIDLSGESLHKRGYRIGQGEAPLKENLAAAILLRAGWKDIAAKGGALVDLMCGVGTLPIEAALIAGNIAPGLLRDYFGFQQWQQHQPQLWQSLLDEAQQVRREIISPIVGFDADARVIRQGVENIQQAGLTAAIHLEKRELAVMSMSQHLTRHPGLVIANPPYGERLGDAEALQFLYRNIGETFKKHFAGWRGAIFTGNPDIGKSMGLRAHKKYAFYNGPLPCELLLFDVYSRDEIATRPPAARNDNTNEQPCNDKSVSPYADSTQMFINRLQKNIKHLEKWTKREHISCYRLYNADLPEYAVAIDHYENYVHVQEYAAPKTIDPHKAEQRLTEILQALPEILNVPAKNIFYKSRFKQSRESQYEKLDHQQKLVIVHEGPAKFLVNFTDYLDTGLFIDQRNVRQKIADLVKNKTFLNLFAYTGTATIYAAFGGASQTVTVDLSATYLQWAKQNLALNGFSEQKHHFIQADCLTWIKQHQYKYDVIFIAPPVFSRSKRMQDVFDIECDHGELLIAAKQLMTKNSCMIFATHKKNFKLAPELLAHFNVTDWKHTLPLDFQRSQNTFYCWLLHPR